MGILGTPTRDLEEGCFRQNWNWDQDCRYSRNCHYLFCKDSLKSFWVMRSFVDTIPQEQFSLTNSLCDTNVIIILLIIWDETLCSHFFYTFGKNINPPLLSTSHACVVKQHKRQIISLRKSVILGKTQFWTPNEEENSLLLQFCVKTTKIIYSYLFFLSCTINIERGGFFHFPLGI